MKTLVFTMLAFALTAQASPSTGKVDCPARAAAKMAHKQDYSSMFPGNLSSTVNSVIKGFTGKKGVK